MKVPTNLVQGALLSLSGFVFWAFGDTCTKLGGTSGLSLPVIIGVASWANTLFFLSAYGCSPVKRKLLWPQSWKRHIFIFILSLLMTPLNVVSFTRLPMTTVYTALFFSPFAISVCAAIFMQEPLKGRQIGAILVGFIGVVMALKPSGSSLIQGQGFGYAALGGFVVLFVAYMLQYRRFQKTETAESLAFIPVFLRALVFLPFFIGLLSKASFQQILYVTMAGVFSGIGTLLMARAFKKAPAAIVSPFHYSQLLIGGVMGYWLWGDRPSLSLVAGSLLIIVSGVCVAHEAHRQGQAQAQADAEAA